jgi:hypothetical protein
MILLPILTAALLQGAPSQLPPQNETSEATAEGIEILRRLLAESLDQAFDEKDENGEEAKGKAGDPDAVQIYSRRKFHGLVTGLWAGDQTVQNSRGFHVADVGVVFAMDLSLPVVSREREKEREEPRSGATDDEWEEKRREVRGQVTRDEGRWMKMHLGGQSRDHEIDPEAIERVTRTVTQTLARHAARIEGLSPQDTITVALHLSGRNHAFWTTSESEPGEEDTGGEALFETAQSYVLAAGVDTPEQHMVLRIRLADLTGQRDGGPSRLAERVKVNRY